MKTYTKLISWMVVLSLILSGCGALGGEATATPEPGQSEDFNAMINATGVVVPEQWATLSVPAQGIVAEVLVAEGDSVVAGQPLLRLDGQAAAEAKVSTAQYELDDAQQALDSLHENAALETALALQTLSSAQQAVIDAERELVRFDLQPYEDDLDRASEAVTTAKDDLKTAQEDFDPYADRDETNETRKNYKNRMDEAQRKYDEALRVEQELILEKDNAAAALTLAQAELSQAQDDYDQRKDGPDPDELALAQSRLDQANAQLLAAQEALKDLELRAPFAGVVCNLQARPGEWLIPGKPVLQLGNLGGLRVETTDLNEIDATRIQPSDTVLVTFDALPGVSVGGTVQRVGYKSAEGSGVNYTVVIQLDQIPDGLRWGMTAFVDIEVKE
jgi:multidrug efflux pump subunit AcrA (membrane-fusion protein)